MSLHEYQEHSEIEINVHWYEYFFKIEKIVTFPHYTSFELSRCKTIFADMQVFHDGKAKDKWTFSKFVLWTEQFIQLV